MDYLAPSMHPVYGGVCLGRGGIESDLFTGGGGMCEPLKGKLCFYMFRLYVRAEMH